MKIQTIQPYNYSKKYISFKSDVNNNVSKNDILTPKSPTEVEFQKLNLKENELIHNNPIKALSSKIITVMKGLFKSTVPERVEDFDLDEYIAFAPYLV